MAEFTYAVQTEVTGTEESESKLRKLAKAAGAAGKKLKEGAEKGAKAFKDSSEVIKNENKGMTNAFLALGAAIGGAAALGALKEWIGESARGAAEMANMSDRVGQTVEEFSTFAAVMSTVGLETEDAASILGDLQERAKEMPADFKKFGIEVRDGNKRLKDAKTLYRETANAISRMENSSLQTAAASVLLSDAGRRALPILKQGAAGYDELAAKVTDAGMVMSTFEAQVGVKVTEAIQRAQGASNNMGTALTGTFGPAIAVVTDRFAGLINKGAGWVRSQRAVIQGGLAEFMLWLGDNAIPAVATGATILTRAWTGWGQIIDAIRMMSAKQFQTIAEGLSKMMSLAARAARALGKEGLARKFEEAAGMHAHVADGFRKDVKKYQDAIIEAEKEQKELEESIGELSVKGSEGIRRLAFEVKTLNDEIAETGPTAKKSGAMVGEAADKSTDKVKKSAAEKKKSTQTTKVETEAAYMDLIRDMESQATATTDLMIESFQDVGKTVDGETKTMESAFGNFFKGLISQQTEYLVSFVAAKATEALATKAAATSQVTANAATAASGAASSQAGIPVVGPALAGAAMAAMLAAVLGLLATFNKGGFVDRGSPANVDSVPAMLTKGELVIPRDLASALQSVMSGREAPRMLPRNETAPQSASGGGATYMTFNFAELPGDPVALERFKRSMEDAI